ncbi:butyrophilin subfamily 1 member A1-like isoform X2 [Anser cygnoides]|uniref:butyrophilin subfamily 1 member A1-like isoform X2 n=1 Tax=Anser cygnoides TaxID=8845 RepID=UPI0034D2E0FF
MGLPLCCSRPSLTSHARGLLTSLFTLLFLWLGSAQLRVEGPDQPLPATVGQDVVLPCHLSPQRDARSLEVRWIRDEFSETVHHYRNGEDLYGEQMEAYVGRTELARDGLSAGNLDLRITGLRPSDDGLYVCTVGDAYNEAIVELEVSAPFFHNAQPWMVALALVLVLLAVSIGLGVYLFRKKVTQSRELVNRDAKLEEQPAEIEEKDARLAELAAKVEEQSAELEKQAAELVRKDAKMVEQAAELAWRRCLLPQNRVKVTLDADTAHPMLVLSQDQTSVRRETEWQQVPDTPERFDTCCCVLGREEFREGRHFWEVEGEGEWLKFSWWAVGVARASVKRKGEIDTSPGEGIWAVEYYYEHLKSLTSPPTHLSLSPVPTRIWVCLDCTQQQVSFINADNGVEIFTFTAASFNGESIHPWFLLKKRGIQLCLRDSTL